MHERLGRALSGHRMIDTNLVYIAAVRVEEGQSYDTTWNLSTKRRV